MKKLIHFLQLRDGIWSVPLAFFAFWFVGVVLQSFFGYGTGTYDPGFIQPLLLAAAIVIGATNIATVGVYFTLRGMHRYLYGAKKENTFFNQSKYDWGNLQPIQRFCIALFVLFFFIAMIVLVYLKLV